MKGGIEEVLETAEKLKASVWIRQLDDELNTDS
jgi:hypothetical protein